MYYIIKIGTTYLHHEHKVSVITGTKDKAQQYGEKHLAIQTRNNVSNVLNCNDVTIIQVTTNEEEVQ